MASASDKEQDGYGADFIRTGAPVEQFDELQADDQAGGDGSYSRSRVKDQTCHVPRGIRHSIHPMISLRCGLFCQRAKSQLADFDPKNSCSPCFALCSPSPLFCC
jgi:hypothetical protein